MEKTIIMPNFPAYEFPCLRPLDLSITTPSPSFQTASTLMKSNTFGEGLDENHTENSPSKSCIKRLRLEQVPIFNFPTHFLSNLKPLELSFL